MSKPNRTAVVTGRMGGLTTAARHDPKVTTRAARERSHGLARFLEQVPTDLPEEERERRAVALRKLFYTRLGHMSAKSRAKKGAKS